MCTLKILWQLKVTVFRPKHTKRDNLHPLVRQEAYQIFSYENPIFPLSPSPHPPPPDACHYIP